MVQQLTALPHRGQKGHYLPNYTHVEHEDYAAILFQRNNECQPFIHRLVLRPAYGFASKCNEEDYP